MKARGLKYPVDIYREGSDQHRGWFQSSLLTSVAVNGVAPYQTVLTHGYVVDEHGYKMSKSLGNGVDPKVIIEGGKNQKQEPPYGADVLRLWVSSVDYSADVRIGNSIVKQLADIYRKIRNTARFLLGNLHDFNPKTDTVADSTSSGGNLQRRALIKLPKIGAMPIVLHRAIPNGFVVKQVRVLMRASGWYAQLIMNSDISIPEPMPHGEPLGIDWGISSFVATSQGELIDNPRFYIQSQSKLKWLQRRLSKKEKGSKSYQRLALKISLLHEKIGNQRKDFHYKVSHHLCRQAGMIFAEDLNILGLSKGMLAKHVLDGAPGQFLSILDWVCRKTGTYHQKVDAKGSSQLCPECGADVPKDLSVRIHNCPECHVVMPRDVASGKIIVNRGIAAVEGLAVKLGVEEDSVESR